MVDASTATRALPDSNEAGLDLVASHVSAAKVGAFRKLGLRIVQGRRQGVRIWDLDGKAYLNCRSSGGVFNFGHRPEFAISVLTRALQELGDMGDWLVPSAVRARGAAALAKTLPGDLRYTFFTPGGGEAVEVACKLARATTGRTGIVSAEHGYHGHVGFALAMDEERDSQWFAPLVPGITKVPFGDIAAVERAITDETAAVAPDLLVAGKGLSGGVYPIAACSFGDRVDEFFGRDPFFHPSSYGGSELGAAVVEAVVGKVTEPGFLDHVNEMGARLAAGFDRLCAAHPRLLVAHRGLGLMRALDTVSPEACYRLMLEAIDGGLLVVWANNKQETLLVMPALVVEADEIDEILHVLDGAATRASAS